MRSPLFVVGMPRSGTTLLSAMLDAHSQIAITPETHFYTRCRSAEAPEADTVEEVWECLRQQPGVQDMQLTDAERRRIVERAQQVDRPGPPALLRALGTTFAERSGAAVWGEKTPDHLAHVSALLRDFPSAAVVCIVRDPRDVCLSLQGVPWNRDSLPEAAWTWRQYARASERYRDAFPHQFRELRYEELLTRPEALLRDVLRWLEVPFEERVLAFHQYSSGSVDAGREPWKAKTQRPLDPSNKEKWRDRMSDAERAVVEWIAGAVMDANGYPRPPITVDASFGKDLARLLIRTARTIGQRWWKRMTVPRREAGDHTPDWIRQQSSGGGSDKV